MENTSELYKDLYKNAHWKETRLLIGHKNTPISEMNVSYGENVLIGMSTKSRMFSNANPSVGSCVSSEITIKMLYNESQPPRHGKLVPQVRISDGARHSEWISKGVYFVDTRKNTLDAEGVKILTLTGFDAMLMTEQDYPSSKLAWPAKDIDVVKEIAAFIGVEVDPRTIEIMTNGYDVQYPGGEYSCRDTLGYIAAMYGGCFIMNDIGKLRLVKLNSIPKGTNYLIDNSGFAITFGGVRILV